MPVDNTRKVQFMPPPQIPGRSQGASDNDLMKQLADRGGNTGAPTGEAGPLLSQGIMLLSQAAKLDPRLAPMIGKALTFLHGGGDDAPVMTMERGGKGGGYGPTPGGVVSS